MRFIAASLVVFSHAFPISGGADLLDPLAVFSNNQMNLGNFAVCLFFVYGGGGGGRGGGEVFLPRARLREGGGCFFFFSIFFFF